MFSRSISLLSSGSFASLKPNTIPSFKFVNNATGFPHHHIAFQTRFASYDITMPIPKEPTKEPKWRVEKKSKKNISKKTFKKSS